jgi:peroxiredoxin
MQIDQPAPDFELPDSTGHRHCLSDYRSRIVIVNFWSAECPHAARTDAALLAALGRWGGQVVLLPVASNANEFRQAPAAAAERGLPLVLLDEGQRVADLYAARTTPHVFVVDPQGLLRYRGAVDDLTFGRQTATRAYLEEAVEALLAGRPPQPAETPPFGCALVRYAPDSC